MGTFKRFEEITAWQKARRLTDDIYKLSNERQFAADFGLRDQIRRASVSIMSNIAEGSERDGKKEFIQFLSIAKGSASEVKSLLYTALDQGYVKKDAFDQVSADADEIGRMIGGLLVYLRSSEIKGHKYK